MKIKVTHADGRDEFLMAESTDWARRVWPDATVEELDDVAETSISSDAGIAVSEPLDRTKISDATRAELEALRGSNPELAPIINVLIGNPEPQ